MNVTQDAWVSAVQFETSRSVRVVAENGGFVLKLPCDVCKETFDYRISKRYPPEVIKKKLKNLGWRVSRNLTCSHCTTHRPAALKSSTILGRPRPPEQSVILPNVVPAPQTQEQVMANLVKAVVQDAKAEKPAKIDTLAQLDQLVRVPLAAAEQPPAAPEPSAEPEAEVQVSKQGHRQMMTLLEEYFDDTKGVYRNDTSGKPYSDARVAEESSVPVAHVQTNREQWFGLLREPVQFAEFKQALEQMRQQCQELQRDAQQQAESIRQEAEVKAQALLKLAGEAVKDLQEKMEVLAAEIDEVVSKNGWAK